MTPSQIEAIKRWEDFFASHRIRWRYEPNGVGIEGARGRAARIVLTCGARLISGGNCSTRVNVPGSNCWRHRTIPPQSSPSSTWYVCGAVTTRGNQCQVQLSHPGFCGWHRR
jgi:hypothetical protein